MARFALPDGEDLDDDLRFDFAALSIEKNPHLDPLLIIVAAFRGGEKCEGRGARAGTALNAFMERKRPINM